MRTTSTMMKPTVIAVHTMTWRGTVQASLGCLVLEEVAGGIVEGNAEGIGDGIVDFWEPRRCQVGGRGVAQELRPAAPARCRGARPARSRPETRAHGRHGA